MEKGFTLVELVVTVGILFAMVVPLFFGVFVKFQSIGKGSHTGYVTAIDKRGYIFQNYEVYFKTDNSSSQEDMYCVHRDNEALAQSLIKASKDRKLITIQYQGVRGIGLGLCHATEIKNIEQSLR